MSTFPNKRIISRHHLQTFLASQTHTDLVNFLTELNESVCGLKLTDEVIESEVSVIQMISTRSSLISYNTVHQISIECFRSSRKDY